MAQAGEENGGNMAITMPEEKSGKRRALGRGLDSLLPRAKARPEEAANGSAAGDAASAAGGSEPVRAAGAASDGRPMEIRLDRIDRNPYQTRLHFDEAALEELAVSIRAMGVIQPVLVRAAGDRFQLIAGERRWIASGRAGRETIPAVIAAMNDEQAMEATIVENLQRADLNPMEQARAFERLAREFHMTQEQIATRTGKDRASVANFLRLLRLPQDLQTQVEGGALSFGHARALLALGSHEEMQRAAQRIGALAMSVRGAESYVKGLLHPEPKNAADKEPEPVDPNVREAQDTLRRALGMRVSIEDRNGRGKVVIEYANLEAFDVLMDRLAGK